MIFRKIIFVSMLLVLAYGVWISPNFKEISAGVAVFLFGMLSLEEGFRAFSGGILERVLKASTNRLWKSISFGFISTTLMQSSSLVSVLTISFISAGLIGLTQGVGIILGANIGTTTGAWLMAGFGLKVKISAYAMPMLIFGVLLIFQKSKSLKGIGYILTGLGFLFLGIHYMKEGFEAYKDSVDLASFGVEGFRGIVIYVGIGILATVIMQSSHATIMLVLAALATNQITYDNAVALTIGANIGTTITAIIGSLSSNIDGKRLAVAHFIFNVITALITLALFNQMLYVVDYVSSYLGISSSNYTLRLAVFDSLFKIGGVIVFIPFINKLVQFLNKYIKNRDSKSIQTVQRAKYLNESVLEFPATTIASLEKDIKRLYTNATNVISRSINVKPKNVFSSMPVEDVLKDKYSKSGEYNFDLDYNLNIKSLYGDILVFSSKAQKLATQEYAQRLYNLKNSSRDITRATKQAKHLHNNLIKYSSSSNRYIKDEYLKIAKRIIKLLRRINTIRDSDNKEEIAITLNKAKKLLRKNDIIANGKLDKLIRKDLITDEMATSLMNDSTYATDLIKELLNAAEELFINRDLESTTSSTTEEKESNNLESQVDATKK